MNCWGGILNPSCEMCDPGIREACAKRGELQPQESPPAFPGEQVNKRLWRNRYSTPQGNVVPLPARDLPAMAVLRGQSGQSVVLPRRQLEWIVEQILEQQGRSAR